MAKRKVSPIPDLVLIKNLEFNEGYDSWEQVDKTDDIEEAVAITSRVVGSDKHKLAIDIDLPVRAIPSSTPGHTHLYIDREIRWDDLLGILYSLADAGIVEQGYADACEEQGFTTLRLPWIKKEVK